MSHLNTGLLAAYNSLTDKHLSGYFNNARIRRHLQRVGLITRSGRIVPDKEYKHRLIQRAHQRHVRECLAQAIFHKVLDMERLHQSEIKRRLEEFARRERIYKIKAERSRRYDEEPMLMLSPRPPTRPKISHAQNSGPEEENSESTESPSSSRPNTAPGKMQRPVRLKPLNSNSATASLRRTSPRHRLRDRDSSNDTDQPLSYMLERDTMRHTTVTDFSSTVSPYRLPVINNYVTPVPPLTKKKERGTRANGTHRGRKLRPTTAPTTAIEPSALQRTSAQSKVLVGMVYFGKSVHLSHDLMDLRDDVKVFQQHCGGENLCVFKGKLREGETFQFVSRRHQGFPFSLTLFLNGLQVDRLSSCCEFKHRKGARLGGKHGHFGFCGVEGASPCYKCIIAMGLDKKPTPPLKRVKEERPTSKSTDAKETPDVNEDRDTHSYSEPRASQQMETDHNGERAEQKKNRDDYEEDFEADDEGPVEDGEEVEEQPSAVSANDEEKETETRDEKDMKKRDRDSESDVEDTNMSKDKRPSSVSSGRTSSLSSSESDSSEREIEDDTKEVAAANVLEESLHTPPEEDLTTETKTEAAESNSALLPQAAVEDSGPQDTVDSTEKSELEMSEDTEKKEHSEGEETREEAKPDKPQEPESERATSIQEKLAEAILKDSHCSSEPELSDTSTEEDEGASVKTQQDSQGAEVEIETPKAHEDIPVENKANIQEVAFEETSHGDVETGECVEESNTEMPHAHDKEEGEQPLKNEEMTESSNVEELQEVEEHERTNEVEQQDEKEELQVVTEANMEGGSQEESKNEAVEANTKSKEEEMFEAVQEPEPQDQTLDNGNPGNEDTTVMGNEVPEIDEESAVEKEGENDIETGVTDTAGKSEADDADQNIERRSSGQPDRDERDNPTYEAGDDRSTGEKVQGTDGGSVDEQEGGEKSGEEEGNSAEKDVMDEVEKVAEKLAGQDESEDLEVKEAEEATDGEIHAVEKENKVEGEEDLKDKENEVEGEEDLKDKENEVEGEEDLKDKENEVEGEEDLKDKENEVEGEEDLKDKENEVEGKEDLKDDKENEVEGEEDLKDKENEVEGEEDLKDKENEVEGEKDLKEDKENEVEGEKDLKGNENEVEGEEDLKDENEVEGKEDLKDDKENEVEGEKDLKEDKENEVEGEKENEESTEREEAGEADHKANEGSQDLRAEDIENKDDVEREEEGIHDGQKETEDVEQGRNKPSEEEGQEINQNIEEKIVGGTEEKRDEMAEQDDERVENKEKDMEHGSTLETGEKLLEDLECNEDEEEKEVENINEIGENVEENRDGNTGVISGDNEEHKAEDSCIEEHNKESVLQEEQKEIGSSGVPKDDTESSMKEEEPLPAGVNTDLLESNVDAENGERQYASHEELHQDEEMQDNLETTVDKAQDVSNESESKQETDEDVTEEKDDDREQGTENTNINETKSDVEVLPDRDSQLDDKHEDQGGDIQREVHDESIVEEADKESETSAKTFIENAAPEKMFDSGDIQEMTNEDAECEITGSAEGEVTTEELNDKETAPKSTDDDLRCPEEKECDPETPVENLINGEEGGSFMSHSVESQPVEKVLAFKKEEKDLSIDSEDPAVRPAVLDRADGVDLVSNWINIHQASRYFQTFIEPLDEIKENSISDEPENRLNGEALDATDTPTNDFDETSKSRDEVATPLNSDHHETVVESFITETKPEAHGDQSKDDIQSSTKDEKVKMVGDNRGSLVTTWSRQSNDDDANPNEMVRPEDPMLNNVIDLETTGDTTSENIGDRNPSETKEQDLARTSDVDPNSQEESEQKQQTMTEEMTHLSPTEEANNKEILDRSENNGKSEEAPQSEYTETNSPTITVITDLTINNKSEDGSQDDTASVDFHSRQLDGSKNADGNRRTQVIDGHFKQTISRDALSTFSLDDSRFFGPAGYPRLATAHTENSY